MTVDLLPGTDSADPSAFEALCARHVDQHSGDPDASLRVLISVDGEDGQRLQRIAEARGKTSHDVIAELLREADRPVA